MNKKWVNFSGLLLSLALIGTSVVGCSTEKDRLTVATTTSLYDTGLWDVLEPMFEKEFDIELDVIYAGTGIALEWGKNGDVDIITIHDKARELQFIADGYGTERYAFAYNYFVIVGPEDDPLGLKGLSPEEAFQKLASSGTAKFISRGDDSGTHSKEKAIWTAAGYAYNTVQQSGEWYVEAGRGMGGTLLMASELQGYTISDLGTFLAYKGDTGLVTIVDQGAILLNVYSAIPVNPDKVSIKNADAAQVMAEWLMTTAIQDIIGQYGVKDYGDPLFTPTYGNEPTS
ncbi:MAG: tungsten ABC transporter substrate-binding protein [Dehalococcoidia bacterium]|nr:MAG: tungsten ABC transporter substrate-binding protein [Dehalococcoidia bacterium]